MSFRNISSWCIKNPVPPIVLFIGLMLAGIIAFMGMTVTNNPDIDFPGAVIIISQPGAAPAEMENQITQKIEAAARGVTGVEEIDSSIREGNSQTFVQFKIGTPTDRAINDLRDAVYVAELNLDQLLARRNASKSFKTLPQFPSIRRDVAMLVGDAVTHDAVLDVVKRAKPANLENVELFDVFRGTNVPAGQKSVAYAFTYRAADKTLTDPEVNAAHDKVVADFKQKLQAAVRE